MSPSRSAALDFPSILLPTPTVASAISPPSLWLLLSSDPFVLTFFIPLLTPFSHWILLLIPLLSLLRGFVPPLTGNTGQGQQPGNLSGVPSSLQVLLPLLVILSLLVLLLLLYLFLIPWI